MGKASQVNIYFLLLVISLCFSPSFSLAQTASASRAMVATADPRATATAVDILRREGNAVDAAIAAQWVLNVVEPFASGLGGGGFFLYYEAATKRVFSWDGREKAPGEAFPEMFLDEDGFPYPFYPDRITGGLPVGVPGTLKLMKEVHESMGSGNFTFEALMEPAVQFAERGFQVSPKFSRLVEQEQERLKLFPASRKMFLHPDESVPAAGEIFFSPDLARTFRTIQERGIEAFYGGEIGEAMVQAVRQAPFHPGAMTLADLREYRVIQRVPLRGSYRQWEIFSMGPPSSGGSTLIEALNILEDFDLAFYGKKPEGIHLFSEAQALAFEDRNRWIGDPDFSEIPMRKILSKDYAGRRRSGLSMEMARRSASFKQRRSVEEGTQTSHISIVDEQGNLVAFTTTIESVFGSGMVVPGWGFVLNNELTDFDAEPYEEDGTLHPNAPEGDKRPRSSMTPTFVFRGEDPVLVLGTPGGSTIIGSVLNVIIHFLDFGMDLQRAVREPRILNRTGRTELEVPLDREVSLVRALQAKGHLIENRTPFGNVQAISRDEKTGTLTGVSDPRGEGLSQGY